MGEYWFCNSSVLTGRPCADGICLNVGGLEDFQCTAKTVINATGLLAPQVARLIGTPPATLPPIYFARGQYFTLSGKPPFQHLVYPVAGQGGLGIHVTLDLSGQVRFGPDLQWIDHIDYRFDPARMDAFVEAIKRYYPGLDDSALAPGYVGIRPKIVNRSEPSGDFMLQSPAEHGIDGLVNLMGIESPGLTASMAVAEEVVGILN